MSQTYSQADEDPKQQKIRFGIICNGTTFQKWEARCIQDMLALDNVKLALLIIDSSNKPLTPWEKFKQIPFKNLLFHYFRKYLIKSAANRLVYLDNLLSQIPTIHCDLMPKGKSVEYPTTDEISIILGYELHFILSFSRSIIPGEIRRAARYGIWSFHHSDEEKYRGGPPGFWEIYKGDNITGAVLKRLTDRDDAIIVLKKGYFKTIKYSYSDNINMIYFASANWPAQVCMDIINEHSDYMNGPSVSVNSLIHRDPGNVQILLFIVKLFYNLVIRKINLWFKCDQWNIGIVHKPIHTFLNAGIQYEVHYIKNLSLTGFFADPFGILQDKKLTILCEAFDYSQFKGVISIIEIVDIENIKEVSSADSRTVIELPAHISYPCLFQYNGDLYCIPETQQLREIGLYKAERFPDVWVKAGTIIRDVAGVDNTIFQYEDRWWLFFTDEERYSFSNLFAWYAFDPLGSWKSHANNPIKTDVRSARPAGTPFVYKGDLYRPAQDCSDTYGGKVVINRVTKLTPTEFKEEQVSVVEPYKNGPYPDGMHTVSAAGNITLIDAKRVMFNPYAFKQVLLRGIKKRLGTFP